MKTVTMPVIVGTLGMIKKESDKYMNKIYSSLNLYEI